MANNSSDNPFLALFATSDAARSFTKKSSEDHDVLKTCIVNEIIENIFCITLHKSGLKSNRDVTCLVYMSNSDECSKKKNFDLEILDQIVFDRIMMIEIDSDHIIKSKGCPSNVVNGATETRALRYLWCCYLRYESCCQNYKDNEDTLQACKNTILSQAHAVLGNISHMLDSNPHTDLYELFFNQEAKICLFMEDVSCKIHAEHGMTELCKTFQPFFDMMRNKLNKFFFTEPEISIHSTITQNIFRECNFVGQAMIVSSYVEADKNGNAFEKTLLGQFFNYSCLSNGQSFFFNEPSRSTDREHRNIEESIWDFMHRRQTELFHLIRVALKYGSKQKMLYWLGDVVRRNLGRTQIGSNHPQMLPTTKSNYVSDGFITNLCACLLKLFAPITKKEHFFKSILKIDPNYILEASKKSKLGFEEGICLKNLPEESCLVPLPENPEEVYLKGEYRFVTECFFMAHISMHSGFSVIHSKLTNISQDLSRHQRLYDDLLSQAHGHSSETIDHIKNFIDTGMTQYLSLKAIMLQPHYLDDAMSFITFTSVWLVNVALGGQSLDHALKEVTFPLPDKMSEYLCYIPEYILENVADYVVFVRRFSPHLFEIHNESIDQFLTLILVFMSNSKAARNPHLRAKLAEMLESLLPHDEEDSMEPMILNTYRQDMFSTHPYCKQIMKTLLHVFVSIEMTGQNVEFEQKFNYRRPMYKILEFIWKIELHRDSMQKLVVESEQSMESVDPPLFLRFINLMINDAIFLLDEALDFMKKIREKQQMIDNGEWNDLPSAQRSQNQQDLRHVGLLARYHNVMSNETIHALTFITEDIKSIFMHPVMIDRITSMLNYFLVHLASPKSKNFKVKDLNQYSFRPQEILSNICQIYINLSDNPESKKFCSAVAADKRSYSPKLFDQAAAVLRKIGKMGILGEFEILSEKIKKINESNMKEEEAMVDAPDEFLDPIMSTIMSDPVLLPSSNMIVDRSTISRHLLSDQSDPFNRSPLTMDMIKPDQELKDKIENWVLDCKAKS